MFCLQNFTQCLETGCHDYELVLLLIVLFATCTMYRAVDSYVYTLM